MEIFNFSAGSGPGSDRQYPIFKKKHYQNRRAIRRFGNRLSVGDLPKGEKLFLGPELGVEGEIGNSGEAGFTLVELTVAGSVFIVIVAIVVTIFLSSLGGQRKVSTTQNVSDNARFLLDAIAKEVRVSTICGRGTVSGSDTVICTSAANNTPASATSSRLDIVRSFAPFDHISYCFGANSLKRLKNNATFTWDPCTDPSSRIMNGPEVIVDSADSGFVISGMGQDAATAPCPPGSATPQFDVCQPRATMLLHVISLGGRNQSENSEVRIQTTVSQRQFDVP